MHVVTELFKKKNVSTRISYLIVIAMLLQVYRHDISCILTQKKMPEKDNFILNTLSYVSDLKITSTDGRPEKEGKGILEILSLSEETYMLYC